MTTSPRFIEADDLRVANEVLSVAAPCAVEGKGYLLCNESLIAATAISMKMLYERHAKLRSGFEYWLLVQLGGWVPDTRIARYRKLWGAYAKSDVVLPNGIKTDEVMVKTADGLNFFGGIKCENLDFSSVAKLVRAGRGFVLVAVETSQASEFITSVTREGWGLSPRSSLFPPEEIVGALCLFDAFLYWPVGGFDDREIGSVLLSARHDHSGDGAQKEKCK